MVLAAVTDMFQNVVKALEYANPTTGQWPLMGSQYPTTVVLLYLILVYLGRVSVQKTKRYFRIARLIVFYDIIMVIYNALIVKEIMDICREEGIGFLFVANDSLSKTTMDRLSCIAWLFYVSKLIECLDTVFFILSGKLHLVTWLHVYHHSTMIPYTWVIARWVPATPVFNLIVTNSLVHVIMYTYYALAAMGPAYRKYLWWKRYLTIAQMVQFVYGIAVDVFALSFGNIQEQGLYMISMVYIFSILLFFYNHFQQTYRHLKQMTKKTQ